MRRGDVLVGISYAAARFIADTKISAKKFLFPLTKLKNILVEPLANGIFKKKDFYGSGVKLVNVFDLYGDTEINFPTLERVEVTPTELKAFGVHSGDIFFCRSSLKLEGIAWSCWIREVYEPAVFECHIIRARVDENLAVPSFVSNFARSEYARKYLLAKANVTTMTTIDQSSIENMPIVLPPLETQRQLVAEMEAARESRRRKLAEADELLRSLDGWLLEQLGITPPPEDNRKVFAVRLSKTQGRFDSYFHLPKFKHLVEALNNSSHPLTSIRRICESPVGGATPTRGNQELYAEKGEGIHFLRILNVKPNEIDLTDVKYIRDSVHNGELVRSKLAANDVLMTITGRVGTAAVVSEEILPANINQHIVRLRLKTDEILPEFLAAYLNTSIGLAISNRSVTGGTRIALDYEAVRSLPIPKPSKPIQEKIIEEIANRKEQANRLRAEAEAEWQAAKQRFEEQLLTGSQ